MTYIDSVSFPDITLKTRLDEYLKKAGMKKSPCINKAIDEYLEKRGA
jgi:metal-responsive CopG/Arc/MetJ family transcriptional regulator